MCIKKESMYVAHTYHPIPVVFRRAEGVHVWDPEGKHYYDFLSAYSAVNQGHCHPDIIRALTTQAQKLTLCSRAFYNEVLPQWAEYITSMFGYDQVLPMNSGAEGVETALKLARRWGYLKKGIPNDSAIIVTLENNFHGRTIGIISTSTDKLSTNNFGPLLTGYITIPWNDVGAFKKVLDEAGSKVCAILLEPIQGEAGVMVPDDGYLTEIYKLCREHKVLFIADEIQTGLARTGRMLAVDWEPECKPDVLILGKALSGGVMPVSCILGNHEIMDVWEPGTHGSTFGGNPLSTAVSLEALKVLEREKLAENANKLGITMRKELKDMMSEFPFIREVRGKGLLNAIDIDPNYKKSAWDLLLS